MADNQEYIVVKMRLQDARRFQADATATAASVKRIGDAGNYAAVGLERAEKRSWLASQAMFTLRRAAYAATLGVAAATAGTVLLGLQFNMQMESATIAFTQFLGSEAAARRELEVLYQLAAHTPFEFTQVTAAAQKFLAFGFSVQDANKYLKIIGDTAAGLGVGAEGIDRATLAIGQMQAKGRIMGEELLQLTELGIPALQILKDELGLTDEQVARIGETGLKASVGIPALMRGLDKLYGGLAAKNAKTLQGQLSTLHDFAAQFAGALTLPLTQALEDDILPTLNELLQAMGLAYTQGGFLAAAAVLDEQIGAGGHLLTVFEDLARTSGALARIFTDALLPALADNAMIAGALLLPAFTALSFVLQGIATPVDILRYALTLLIFWQMTEKTILLVTIVYTKSLALWTAILTAVERRRMIMIMLVFWWTLRMNEATFTAIVMQRIAAFATLLWAGAMVVLEGAMIAAGVAAWLLTAAIYAIPIVGWVLLAITALVALYYKWQWFHDLVDSTFRLIIDNGPMFAAAFGMLLGPLGVVIAYLTQIWNLVNAIKDAADWAGGVLSFSGGDLLGVVGMAGGGVVQRSGWAITGERGPELQWHPKGATVAPLDGPDGLDIGGITEGGGREPTIVRVYLDKRMIAEAVAESNADARARRE